LNKQLQQSKVHASSYLEKNRQQDQAILSAQRELGRLHTTIRKLETENCGLHQKIQNLKDIMESGRLDKEEETLSVRDQLLQQKQIALDHEEENRKLHHHIKTLEGSRSSAVVKIGLREAIQVRDKQKTCRES
jgi:hypothetical protein